METAVIAKWVGISPESTMGYGYSGARITLADADTRWTWKVLHAWCKAALVVAYFSHPGTRIVRIDGDGLPVLTTPMGVGSAGRESGAGAKANFWSRNSRTPIPGYNGPSRMTPEGRAYLKKGYAPIAYPGTSAHEDDTWEKRAIGVDSIGWEDGFFGRFVAMVGLLTFWNTGNEPWHTQPAGYGKSKSDLQRDLRARGLPTFNLPKIPLAVQYNPPPEPTPPAPPAPPIYTFRGAEMYKPITPFRNSDTRYFGGSGIAAKTPHWFGLDFAKMGVADPSTVIAVTGTITVVGAQAGGFATIWPGGDVAPDTTSITYFPGTVTTTSFETGVVGGGFRCRLHTLSHVIVDITGYHT